MSERYTTHCRFSSKATARLPRLSGGDGVTLFMMHSVQTVRRLRPGVVLLLAVVAAGCFATQASAIRYPPNGLRFFVDSGISPPPSRSLINVESIRGSLRVVSIRAVSDVRAGVPAGSAGKTVGELIVGVRGSTEPGKRFKLVMPTRTSASKLVLLHVGQLSVVLRPSGRRSTGSGGANNLALSIHGLPTGATYVSVTFDGTGRGVLGTTHGCPVKPTWNLYAVRVGAAPVSVNSRIACGTPPK